MEGRVRIVSMIVCGCTNVDMVDDFFQYPYLKPTPHPHREKVLVKEPLISWYMFLVSFVEKEYVHSNAYQLETL